MYCPSQTSQQCPFPDIFEERKGLKPNIIQYPRFFRKKRLTRLDVALLILCCLFLSRLREK